MKRYGRTLVPITLLGEEWFALLARITGRELSPEGSRICREATLKLSAQLNEALDKHIKRKRLRRSASRPTSTSSQE